MRVLYLPVLFCFHLITGAQKSTLSKNEAPLPKQASRADARSTTLSFLNKANPFGCSIGHALLILTIAVLAMNEVQAASPYKVYRGQHVEGDFTSQGAAADAEMKYYGCSEPGNTCSATGDSENLTSWERKITITQTPSDPRYNPVTWDTRIMGYVKWYCPSGHVQSGNTCVRASYMPDPHKDCGPPDCSEGNPINAASGNKFQRELDYKGTGVLPLHWERNYNSAGTPSDKMNVAAGGSSNGDSVFTPGASTNDGGNIIPPVTVVGRPSNSPIGIGWRHTYDRTVVTQTSSGVTTATLYRHNGRVFTFQQAGTAWVPEAGDKVTRLVRMTDGSGQLSGWQYTNDQNELESYDAAGKLLSIQSPGGWLQAMHYNGDNYLDRVTDSAGRTLSIGYDTEGRVSELTDPDGGSYLYEYSTAGNLLKVTYPDMGVRQYIYEDTKFRSALTGIIDENGIRFATWTYDATTGKGKSSEHVNGAEKVTLTYGTTNSATDAGGATRTYSIQVLNGYSKVKAITETCGTGCSRSRTMSYDANGNPASSTDWNGNRTTYTFDLSRNLETKRVEAGGTAQARTITTEWHPTYRLPTRISEPKRITANSYDANGNLLSRSMQETTDATGAQGFGATVVGSARVWRYTYNDVGQVLTVTDPRNSTTTYSYDDQGNLVSITNAAGHVTTLSNYDPSGRVGRIADPNGLITDLTYHPRGWLMTKTVGGEANTYDYDGVGQLKKVTLPDGSYVSYDYDDSHRLTGIADSLGNRIVYTLDLMGNRIKEEVKDPNGTLVREVSRIYDAINRLQQTTGGMQ